MLATFSVRTPAKDTRSRHGLRIARTLVAAGLFAAIAAACGSDPASPTTPGNINKVSGDSQTVVAAAALASPMVVRVLAENGSPLSGTVVTWTLASGAAGTLAASTSTTDAAGQASVAFTAGTIAGTVTISATTTSITAVNFTQFVTAGPATGLAKFAGDGTAALAGSGVQAVVRVVDTYGNPVSGVTVNWATGTGGGTLSATTSTSDASGLARVTLTLGTAPGVYTVRATSGTFTPVTFSITAI